MTVVWQLPYSGNLSVRSEHLDMGHASWRSTLRIMQHPTLLALSLSTRRKEADCWDPLDQQRYGRDLNVRRAPHWQYMLHPNRHGQEPYWPPHQARAFDSVGWNPDGVGFHARRFRSTRNNLPCPNAHANLSYHRELRCTKNLRYCGRCNPPGSMIPLARVSVYCQSI